MVSLHITQNPAHWTSIGPWFMRALTRLWSSFTKPERQQATAHAAQDAIDTGFAAGFTRVDPLQQLAERSHAEIGDTPVFAFHPVPGSPADRAQAVSAPAKAPALRADRTRPAPRPTRPTTQFHAVAVEQIPLVLVLSRRSGTPLTCFEWLNDHDLPFRRIAALHPTSPIWSAPRDALLIVDLDTLGGVTAVAEGLMRLRQGRPDISIVLLSEEVAGHDFGLERLALADVTLRLPCAFASFEFALAEAPINNAIWQERVAEMRQGA